MVAPPASGPSVIKRSAVSVSSLLGSAAGHACRVVGYQSTAWAWCRGGCRWAVAAWAWQWWATEGFRVLGLPKYSMGQQGHGAGEGIDGRGSSSMGMVQWEGVGSRQ